MDVILLGFLAGLVAGVLVGLVLGFLVGVVLAAYMSGARNADEMNDTGYWEMSWILC